LSAPPPALAGTWRALAPRQRVLALALLATLALCLLAAWWPAAEAPADLGPVPRARSPRAEPGPRAAAGVAAASSAGSGAVAGTEAEGAGAPPRQPAWPALVNAGRVAWQGLPPAPPPAPARAAAPAAPLRPAPPKLPYTLFGRYEDGAGPVAWLLSPQRTLAVRVGDQLEAQWRVEAIGPQQVVLTWLPGGERQTLSFANP
jgi:hypothetical protein